MESYLKHQINMYLKKIKRKGAKVYWFKTSGDPVGIPDFILCINGKFIAIELKTIDGKIRKAQKVQMSEIAKAGGIVKVVRSLDEFKDFVNTIIGEKQDTEYGST